jgi:hypothetical protein
MPDPHEEWKKKWPHEVHVTDVKALLTTVWKGVAAGIDVVSADNATGRTIGYGVEALGTRWYVHLQSVMERRGLSPTEVKLVTSHIESVAGRSALPKIKPLW